MKAMLNWLENPIYYDQFKIDVQFDHKKLDLSQNLLAEYESICDTDMMMDRGRFHKFYCIICR